MNYRQNQSTHLTHCTKLRYKFAEDNPNISTVNPSYNLEEEESLPTNTGNK